MKIMSKKTLVSFFRNLKYLEEKMKAPLLAYFEDFHNDTKFNVELKESKIFVTSLSGEVIAFVNVPSR